MRRLMNILLALACVAVMAGANACAEEETVDTIRVYIGTYTRKESQGIYTFELNLQTGTTTEPELAAELVNPSFVAFSPDHKYLYAVNEVSDFPGSEEKKAGGVTGFRLDAKSGALTLLNSQLSGGVGPCHVTVDGTGKCVVVANYGSGSAASFPVSEQGELAPAATVIQHEGSSVNPKRQQGPHAHSANIDAGNNYVVIADLGLDQLRVYKLNAEQATLTPNDPPFVKTEPGVGPRHFNFHPNGRFAYSNNEMASSVTAYGYDPEEGVLTPMMTQSTLPEDYDEPGNSTAETLVHPSGKFLYVSNRGHNSIAIFRIQNDGSIEPLGHHSTLGNIPRNFGIDPTGKYLLAANQDSDTIALFEIDQKTGRLKETGNLISVPTPVCVRMIPIE